MTPPHLSVQPEKWIMLYGQGQHNALAQEMLSTLNALSATPLAGKVSEVRAFVDRVLELFLRLFTKDDFTPERQFWHPFLQFNELISNLAAFSTLKNTDQQLSHLLGQRSQLFKVLTLYSARNTIRINPNVFFDADAALASEWYVRFVDLHLSALVNPVSFEHLKLHLAAVDARFLGAHRVEEAYYGATYIDEGRDVDLKRLVNQSLQARFRMPALTPVPKRERPRIAVISGAWREGHSVHKNQYPFLRALTKDFDLSLFELAPGQDRSLFQTAGPLEALSEGGLRSLGEGGFQMVYYPDIGMNGASIVLANLRLAPIQVCSYGHSVSTFGSCIDYFIVGAATEDRQRLSQNYSERPVLIPGLGIISLVPTYAEQPRVPMKRKYVLIACPWSAQKCNVTNLTILAEIAAKSALPIVYRFLVGPGVLRNSGHLPFAEDVRRIFGTNGAEVVLGQNYEQYMQNITDCDFGVDSFHFGGCNSVVDLLYLNKPIVTLEGARWYGRIGAGILRSIGMEELVAQDTMTYQAIVARLVADAVYRNEVSLRIKESNFAESEVFQTRGADGFVRAIHHLINHHETLSREPLSREPGDRMIDIN